MKNTSLWAPVMVISLLACGSAKKPNGAESDVSSATNVNSGAVEGITLQINSAASKARDGNSGLRLVLSNASDYCAASSSNQLPKNHVTFSATLLGKLNDQNQLISPVGTYTMVYDQPATEHEFLATGNFDASDANCRPLLEDTLTEAESGTVTLTEVTDAGVTGTYNVTFKGGTIQGRFSAPACPTSDMISGKLCQP